MNYKTITIYLLLAATNNYLKSSEKTKQETHDIKLLKEQEEQHREDLKKLELIFSQELKNKHTLKLKTLKEERESNQKRLATKEPFLKEENMM